MLEVEWDETKRLANLRKHGVDFADVPFMDWDNATILEDTRFGYPERRFWAFGGFAGPPASCGLLRSRRPDSFDQFSQSECARGEEVWQRLESTAGLTMTFQKCRLRIFGARNRRARRRPK
jgi:hypothetical protein